MGFVAVLCWLPVLLLAGNLEFGWGEKRSLRNLSISAFVRTGSFSCSCFVRSTYQSCIFYVPTRDGIFRCTMHDGRSPQWVDVGAAMIWSLLSTALNEFWNSVIHMLKLQVGNCLGGDLYRSCCLGSCLCHCRRIIWLLIVYAEYIV
ncbi:hypothetical protein BCR43DRAFT_187859 [Syncephalastrum racemosum]|uniref:Secreted protein n=1 Tax=Syncephalastrum racemosum TaxID=13706 RepID=A0A1X2HQP0_SYNRA|nr:hypothetical protein BCR43DRAFT_187831 [Syncephalastrum racemosum]ORZ01667.1 hypothetical protein BCR43DRAFT_187859 [Syncephalastrum racemosum]